MPNPATEAKGSRNPTDYGLPHREPFIFVDEVQSIDPGRAAECKKLFKADEPFFRGHFPGTPLVPGVLLAEGMAQTAGIAAGSGASTGSYRLSAIKLMKFLRPVLPEMAILFRAEKTGEAAGLLQFNVEAIVDGEVASTGVIVLSQA